jgi:hypothetical protein
MSPEGRPRITCSSCVTLTCREYRGESGVRHIEGLDGSRIDAYPEVIFDCNVLREEVTEEYILWLLGMELLREILIEETS